MTIPVSTILSRCRTQLIDAGATRWTDAELYQWIADGCRAITAIVPSATATTNIQSLVAGTLQSIPDNGHMLFNVVRNFDTTGTVPGRAIRLVTRSVLDGFLPNWHSAPASPIVQNYVFDPLVPDVFYVYPPNNGLGKVELTYALAIADFTDPTTQLPIWDIYQTPLFDYTMYRAHSKDGDWSAGMQVAAGYLQAFNAFMQVDDRSQLESNPNLTMGGFNPQVRGAAKE